MAPRKILVVLAGVCCSPALAVRQGVRELLLEKSAGAEEFPCGQLRRGIVKCDESHPPELLGKGSFGSTWLAELANSTEKVVVKLLFGSEEFGGGYLVPDDERGLEKLRAWNIEVRNECLPAKLVHEPGPSGKVHPSAQRVRRCLGDNFDTAAGHELFYVLLKDAGDITLLDYQVRSAALGTWNTTVARKAIKQLLQGLEAIASIGWVHHDLSCKNVMVREAAGGPLLQIIDFGFGLPAEAPKDNVDSWTAASDATASVAFDAYSAGIVAAELLFVLDWSELSRMAPPFLRDSNGMHRLKKVKWVADMLSQREGSEDFERWAQDITLVTMVELEDALKSRKWMDDPGDASASADMRPDVQEIRERIRNAMGGEAGEPFDPVQNLLELSDPAAIEFLRALAELLHPTPAERPSVSKLLETRWMQETIVADNPDV